MHAFLSLLPINSSLERRFPGLRHPEMHHGAIAKKLEFVISSDKGAYYVPLLFLFRSSLRKKSVFVRGGRAAIIAPLQRRREKSIASQEISLTKSCFRMPNCTRLNTRKKSSSKTFLVRSVQRTIVAAEAEGGREVGTISFLFRRRRRLVVPNEPSLAAGSERGEIRQLPLLTVHKWPRH